jgi:hypothetical protein
VVSSPKWVRRILVSRRKFSSSRINIRFAGIKRVLDRVPVGVTERYVSAINVKCLLFLFKLAAPILADRIAD